MIDIRAASLLDFLPRSIVNDPEVVAMARALDPEMQAVSAAIVEAIILPRISEQPEWVLDELAWAFRLDRLQIWDNATIEGKRAVLADIFKIRKCSGTKFAVERVFMLLSVVGKVIEWFEEGAPPSTYRIRITVDEVGISLLQLIEVSELTQRFARTSAKLREFAVESSRPAMQVRTVVTRGRLVTLTCGA